MSPQTAPYGTWSSPITAEAITKGATSFTDLIVDPVTSDVYHLESRPSEKGRNTLVNTKTGKELTPGEDWNVRTGVHEYGGAPAIVYNGVAYFSRFSDGRVYQVKEGDVPEPVTPESEVHRFANFEVHPVHTHLLVSVLEDHTVDMPAKIINTLCVINTDTKTIRPLISGADFYALPKFSPDGTRFAWQQWNHPDMPWEGGQVLSGEVSIDHGILYVKNSKLVAGEPQDTSAGFPSWSSNNTLIFTSDKSGYINPWIFQNGTAAPVFSKPIDQEYGAPLWQFQLFPYTILDKAGNYALFVTTKDGRNGLEIVDLTKKSDPQPLATSYVVINSIRSVSRETGEIVFIGGKVDEDFSIVKVTITDPSAVPAFVDLKLAAAPPFSHEFVSIPQPMTFNSAEGSPIHAIFYGPKNPEYSGSSIGGERPPCAVYAHGGPTSISLQSLNWRVQYFTSRGWAYLDVNYGGSSGYGRKYIERLAGRWGLVDVDDTIQASRIISAEPYKLVDPKRIVVRGGSAGGYTVLAALANAPDVTAFAAGTSSYGISDMYPLVKHTHKFESHYMEKLMGGTPEEIPEVYTDRSPLHHADRIVTPLLILQGEIDKVVPKEQAQLIYDKIKAKGGVIEYKLYPGEGHGWRQEETIVDALERELGFYESIFQLKI